MSTCPRSEPEADTSSIEHALATFTRVRAALLCEAEHESIEGQARSLAWIDRSVRAHTQFRGDWRDASHQVILEAIDYILELARLPLQPSPVIRFEVMLTI